VVRASVTAEKAGYPAVSIVLTGFLTQAKAVARALGIKNAALAEYPGIVSMDSKEELRRKVTDVLVPNIIAGFTRPATETVQHTGPAPRDIVFEGSLDEVQEYFYKNNWTDGLPVIPPTREKVDAFLKFTSGNPDEIIGNLLPENREATVWNVAVNGVMAGCRPEYMPILLAAVDAIAAPEFRIQDGGATPGWEPLIILNGPVIKQLGFNYETGVMRVGRRANTSIGRFLKLYMMNIAGLRIPPGLADKATIGSGFNVVLPENEDVIAELGWESFSMSRGFNRGDNVVTVQSVVYETAPMATGGEKAADHLETLAEVIGGNMAPWTHVALNWGKFYPLIVISPGVAKFIAGEGITKNGIKQYLYEHTKVSVKSMERLAHHGGLTSFDVNKLVAEGIAPRVYGESTDPNRMVPVFLRPEWIGIVVSGDSGRTRCRGYVQNHEQGPPVSRKVVLPPEWEKMIPANPL
jgi:hypothetical protein